MSDIKHVEEPIDETEDIDLGLMLAPLSRQQLEMLICQMISRHPEEFDIVKDEATKDVDVSIYAQVSTQVESARH